MSAALLQFDAVTRRYGRNTALADLSFSIGQGEAVALLGLNGAGKSTLFRLALGLCRPDLGRVAVAGCPPTESGARLPMAYLPEHFKAPHYLRGREWLRAMAALYGAVPDDAAITAECARLGLAAVMLDAPVRSYSQGMTRKLGLIACLLSAPDFLLLDEPMSGLDPRAIDQCQARLLAARDAGVTILFSSHDLKQACALANRIMVLHAGHLLFDGSVMAFLARDPHHEPSAAFLSLAGD